MENFNSLSIQEQVNIINKLLGTDKNLNITRICEKLGVPSSTLKSRLSKEGYKFNKNKHIYQLQKDFLTRPIIEGHENSVNQIKEYNESISIAKDEIAVTNELGANLNDVDINKLKYLLENIDVLEKIFNEYQESTLKNCIIDLSLCTEKSVNRNFKVYGSVLKKLTKLQKEYSMFKIQDLVSTAISEYCDKYLNKI